MPSRRRLKLEARTESEGTCGHAGRSLTHLQGFQKSPAETIALPLLSRKTGIQNPNRNAKSNQVSYVTPGQCISFLLLYEELPTCNSSEHHPFMSSQLCSSWVWHGMAGVPLLRVPQGGNPGLAGSIPLWRHWARISFQTHSGRWQNLVLCWLAVGAWGGSGPLTAACSPALSHASDPFPLCFQRVHAIRSNPQRSVVP